MDSEVIVERWTPPPRDLVPLTFRRTFRLSDGRSESTINRGETAGVPADQVAWLLRQQIAVAPGAALDPLPPDTSPVLMRLLRPWRSGKGQPFASNERATVPRFEADRLISAGAAVLDDGRDVVTTDEQVTRRRSRIQARGRQLAAQILERYR